jgi:hypothetical protein
MNGRVLIIAGSDSGGGAGMLAAIEHPSVIAKIHGRRPALAVGGCDAILSPETGAVLGRIDLPGS